MWSTHFPNLSFSATHAEPVVGLGGENQIGDGKLAVGVGYGAADDFGSGYSSLMLLRNVEFDAIKIDQNFIRGMLDRTRDKILVNIMIDCAHKLNTAVCVEGVETEELMDITRGFAAEYFQGYLIAKPLELNSLKLFMASRELTQAK